MDSFLMGFRGLLGYFDERKHVMYLGIALQPRGTRNNDPPNDRLIVAWQGLIGSEVELLG